MLITEVGVRASALVSRGRIFAEVHGPVDTAIAFANPHTTRADIGFYLTDGNGSRIAEGTFSLEAHQQMATFLSAAPFNVESVVGAFTFTASAPLAVVALRELTNQVGEWLLTTLPVTPTRPPPSPFSRTPTAPVLFPHFADGLGWSTQVILVNPTAQPIAGTVEFLGPDAAPAVLTLSDGRRGSRFDYEIPAESARRFATSNTAGPLSSGWVRATPSRSASPSGLLVFSFSSADKTISEVGVPALGASSAFRVPVDALGAPNRPGSIRTGLAIANTTDEESTVTLEITRPDGSLVRPIATLTLPPLGQSARMLDKIVRCAGRLHLRAAASERHRRGRRHCPQDSDQRERGIEGGRDGAIERDRPGNIRRSVLRASGRLGWMDHRTDPVQRHGGRSLFGNVGPVLVFRPLNAVAGQVRYLNNPYVFVNGWVNTTKPLRRARGSG